MVTLRELLVRCACCWCAAPTRCADGSDAALAVVAAKADALTVSHNAAPRPATFWRPGYGLDAYFPASLAQPEPRELGKSDSCGRCSQKSLGRRFQSGIPAHEGGQHNAGHLD